MKPILKFFNLIVYCCIISTACSKNENANDNTIDNNPVLYTPAKTYQIETLPVYIVIDSTRSNRAFKILGRKPIGLTQPYPLILFSHGGGYNNNGHLSYEEWAVQIAQAGYFVINIANTENPYACAYCDLLGIKPDEREPSDLMTDVVNGGTLPSVWYDKPRDIVAVLNNLDKIETAANLKFDRNRIGVAGHSGGAFSVMVSGGTLVDFSPTVRDVVIIEPRIKAFLALSPQGEPHLGLDSKSWNNFTRPFLTVTGPNDIGPEVKDPKVRLDPFKYAPGPDKYQLYLNLQAANHEVFGLNEIEGTNNLSDKEKIIKACGVAFLDAYIKGESKALDWLKSDQINQLSAGAAVLSRK